MTRVGLALALLLWLATPGQAYNWVSAGVQTNPLANTILADTGALTAQGGTWNIICDASAMARLSVEHRDSTNASNVDSQTLTLMANSPAQWSFVLSVLDNERLRVRLLDTLVGFAQCSILYN